MDNNRDSQKTFQNVPVQVELGAETAEILGLRAFGVETLTVDVTLKGRQIDLNRVTTSDFEVLVKPVGVVSPGQYPVSVSAERTNSALSFEVAGFEPTTVMVQIDRYVENKKFTMEAVNEGNAKVPDPDGYSMEKPHVSPSDATISGPESVIERIDRVVAQTRVDGEINVTRSYPASLILYDKYNNVINQSNLSITPEKVEVVLTVFAKKDMAVNVKEINGPKSREGIKIDIKPASKLKVFCPTDISNNPLNEITLDGAIDFSKINLTQNQFKFPVGLPTGYHLENPVENITVEVLLAGKKTVTYTAETLQFANAEDGKKYTITTPKIDNVVILGSGGEIDSLTPADIVAVIDVPEDQSAEQMEMPVRFEFKNHPSCWAYGSYTATIRAI